MKKRFPFNFTNILEGRHFAVDRAKSFKPLADISFESGLPNIVLLSLLRFSRACYYVDLDDIEWNQAATSTTRNFNNSRPVYLNFWNMINLCPNIWFIENSECQQFLIWKKTAKKHTFFMCLRGRYFVMGGPIDMNFDMFWETSVGLMWFCNFFWNITKVTSIWMSKVEQNSTALKK